MQSVPGSRPGQCEGRDVKSILLHLYLHTIVCTDERGTVRHLEIAPKDEPDLCEMSFVELFCPGVFDSIGTSGVPHGGERDLFPLVFVQMSYNVVHYTTLFLSSVAVIQRRTREAPIHCCIYHPSNG